MHRNRLGDAIPTNSILTFNSSTKEQLRSVLFGGKQVFGDNRFALDLSEFMAIERKGSSTVDCDCTLLMQYSIFNC